MPGRQQWNAKLLIPAAADMAAHCPEGSIRKNDIRCLTKTRKAPFVEQFYSDHTYHLTRPRTPSIPYLLLSIGFHTALFSLSGKCRFYKRK